MIYLAVGYLVVCAYLYLVQQRRVYVGAAEVYTPEQARHEAALVGLVPWPADDPGHPIGWTPPNFAGPAPRGTIVVLHGNGETAWERAGQAGPMQARGFRVLFYEYPGYGGRPGRPSERVIVPEVRDVVRRLDQAGLGPIYLWGQSLGSGAAAEACADPTLPVRGLALVTPFDSLPSVAASYYPFLPVRLLMTDRYNSVKNLAHFTGPVCVLRSDHDEVVPAALSLRLYDALPGPKKMIVFTNAGHADWPGDTPDTWWDEALDFIAPRS
ncbi:MAG: alpha/beta fold hydrolase [Verrucomicrobiota bacterium]